MSKQAIRTASARQLIGVSRERESARVALYSGLGYDATTFEPSSLELPPIVRLVASMTPVIPLRYRVSCFFAGINPATGRKVPSVKTYLKRIRRGAKVALNIFLHG